MSRLTRAALRLLPLRWRAPVERDLSEEATRAGRQGLSRDVWIAWHAARIGTMLRCRQPRGRGMEPRSRWAKTHMQSDGRMALRMFVRDLGSTAAIVLTLALGIAATTTVYAVFNHLVFRPMPGVRDPAELVTIAFQPEDQPRTWSSGSPESISLFRATDTGLSSMATVSGPPDAAPVVLRPGEDPRLLDVELVSPGYFETLGVRPRLGRLFTTEETRDPGHAVAVISDVLWRHEFDRSETALGRTLNVNGQPFTIVGIVKDYRGWGPTAANAVDVWLPEPGSRAPGARPAAVAQLIGRAHPGISLSALQAQLRRLYAPLRATLDGSQAEGIPWVYPGLRRGFLPNGLDVSFPLILGIAGLVTLLACANAANLLLARTTRRRHDLALRAAIGATRWRLIQALLLEAILLAAAAVVCGLALTLVVARLLEGTRVFMTAGALAAISIDWRVATFAAAIGTATVLIFALAPILSATRIDLRTLIQESSRSATGSQTFRRALVATQIALSFLLMAAAGVLVHSLWNLRAINLGMNPAEVFAFTLNPRLAGQRGATGDELVKQAVARLQDMPGVSAVGTANPPAFRNDVRMLARVRLETEQPAPGPLVETSVVSPDYFATVGVPLVAGRTFTRSEVDAPANMSVHTGIINLSLARALFGQHPAVGQRIAIGGMSGQWHRRREVEIVGVVGDSKTAFTLRQPAPAMMLYEPRDAALVSSRIYIRSPLSTATLQGRVYQSIRALSSQWPLIEPGTLTEEVERLMPEDIAFARLLLATAIVAILLGFTGVYSVTAYSVSERTREFGVRIALGASGAAIIRHANRAVGLAAIAGAAIGLTAYSISSRLIASRLYGISRLDPIAILGAMILLAVVTLIAAWIPARRATRIDPVVALRAD